MYFILPFFLGRSTEYEVEANTHYEPFARAGMYVIEIVDRRGPGCG